MVYEVLKNLLSECIVYVASLYLDLILLVIFLFVFWLCLKANFDKDPYVFLYLLLDETALIHENCLDSFLLELLWQKRVTKNIDTFGHPYTIALLLYW